MGISLRKNQTISLSKENIDLKKVLVGLGWDVNSNYGGSDYDLDSNYGGSDYDLDVTAFLLNENGRVRHDKDFIFYGNLKSIEGTVQHMGDNLTGEGEGDDEQICINLQDMPSDICSIAFVVTIYDSKARKQNFGQVENSYVRIVDQNNSKEVCKYNLTEDYSYCQSIIVGTIERNNSGWTFKATGQGLEDDLSSICKKYGIDAK